MGDAQGQGRLEDLVFFLDENHCGNRHLHAAFRQHAVRFEKHTDHFPRGTEDTVWLTAVAARGWIVLTADARIRHNKLERLAVKQNILRLFYFARNDISGIEMGAALEKALPKMLTLCRTERPPFVASLSRSGEVTLRDVAADLLRE